MERDLQEVQALMCTILEDKEIDEECIRLKEEDRDSHQGPDLSTGNDAICLRFYRMTRVTFGVISSPFLAICTTQEHARRCKETFPEVSDEILRNTHVDDFASGKDGVYEALEL
ncbi:hypothetical protein OS493_008143 [Desmophyllum pertusum]|uniref:Uncharacterized protein n=1 Tax=Desmophyllum pertusum TaxID=174260 RepID=A0A9X0DAU4_9CNID|nr:hypothetical protein OS493_008143 [Desmophyllum pertusum]